jgi:hypothetical protein
MGILANPYARSPMMPLDGPQKRELAAALDIMRVNLPKLERAGEGATA